MICSYENMLLLIRFSVSTCFPGISSSFIMTGDFEQFSNWNARKWDENKKYYRICEVCVLQVATVAEYCPRDQLLTNDEKLKNVFNMAASELT